MLWLLYSAVQWSKHIPDALFPYLYFVRYHSNLCDYRPLSLRNFIRRNTEVICPYISSALWKEGCTFCALCSQVLLWIFNHLVQIVVMLACLCLDCSGVLNLLCDFCDKGETSALMWFVDVLSLALTWYFMFSCDFSYSKHYFVWGLVVSGWNTRHSLTELCMFFWSPNCD